MFELALHGVVVELNATIIYKKGKPYPPLFDVSDRLSHVPFFEISRFQFVQPFFDPFQNWR